MKTENNLENKAKFFAQYWGQHVLYFRSDFLRKIDISTLDVDNDDFLELTPLSEITDEDAEKISLIENDWATENHTHRGKVITRELYKFPNWDNVFDTYYKTQNAIDYLRSKGYALPWLDLSVDDLISYGWVKLK